MRPPSGWTDPDLGTALGINSDQNSDPSNTATGSITDPSNTSTTDPNNTGSSGTTSKNIPIIAGAVGGVVVIAGIAIVFLLVRRHKKNAVKIDGAAGGAGGVVPSEPPPPPMTPYDPHHSMVNPPSTPGLYWDPQSGTYYQPAPTVASPGPGPQFPGAGGYYSYKPTEQSPIAEMPAGARPAPQELPSMQH